MCPPCRCRLEIRVRNDSIAAVDRFRPMAGDPGRHRPRHPVALHVADSRPSQVVHDPPGRPRGPAGGPPLLDVALPTLAQVRPLQVGKPGQLKALPHFSPLRFLGYFAMLESLLTHAPNPSDPYDSITRQVQKRRALLELWPFRWGKP